MTGPDQPGVRPKMGGRPELRILIKANRDVVDSLLGGEQGGGKLTKGLAEVVDEKYGAAFRVEITQEPAARSEWLVRQLEGSDDPGVPSTSIWAVRPDIIVLSAQADLEGAGWDGAPDPDSPPFVFDLALGNLSEIVRSLKDFGAHVLVYNCTTIDPDDQTYNYHRVDAEPAALRAHRLNLALAQLSSMEGISVIDVDLLMAELGAAAHVIGKLEYSEAACEAIRDEVLRVLDEYGFFEERPLVLQVAAGEGS